MNRPIGTALLGYGLSGQFFHAPFLKGMEEYAITDVWVQRPERAEEVRSQGLNPNTNLEEILKSEAVELVVITVPNGMHADLAKRALRAGKHVVLEKPMTITSREADDLIEEARKCDRKLSVFHNRRWDSDFLTVRKLVKERALGRLVEFESHFDRYRPAVKDMWREQPGLGTGLLYDLGPHLIDQALALFGLPEALFADLRIQRSEAKTIDAFELILFYGELKVTLKVGCLVREPLPRFILMGERGSFIKYGLDVQEDALRKGAKPIGAEDWGKEPDSMWGHLHADVAGTAVRGRVESESGDYSAYYRQLADAIRNGGPLPVEGVDGRNVIRLIELAMESHAEGKRIRLDGRY